MATVDPQQIEILVLTTYLSDHSQPQANRFTFAYTITINNHSDESVQLLSRHWVITDANNNIQEVRGEGVVGEQPVIERGGQFQYTSGATLATEVGYMRGSYTMIAAPETDVDPAEQPVFEVPIPPFTLHTPNALH